MPLQRACVAENQARNSLSNGPLRVQSNVVLPQSILQRCRQSLTAEGILVPCKSARIFVNSRWHRG
ncbi:MAG: hypothetical protein E7548_03925 [Ruminococcaceae bacterium]|nr:hypothetical protein [Oscillospiraceae bacterium]